MQWETGGTAAQDDAWWTSVMQEEHRGYSPRGRAGAPAERCAGTSMDWSRARELYEQDGIAQVDVVGCNRGGLLVEAEGLRGFVPAYGSLLNPVDVTAAIFNNTELIG